MVLNRVGAPSLAFSRKITCARRRRREAALISLGWNATGTDLRYACRMQDGLPALISRLTEARDRLARQTDTLVSLRSDHPTDRKVDVGGLIKHLQSTLSEIEDCIAALDDLNNAAISQAVKH